MALIAYDGFDHYNSETDLGQRFGVLQYYSIIANVNAQGSGRTGVGKCLYVQELLAGLSLPVNQLTIGFAYNAQGGTNVPLFPVKFIDQITGATQCYFLINNTNGTISFFDASGALVVSGLNSISANGWYFIELQAKISRTVGIAAIRINGEPIASFPDQANLNTQSSTNSSVSGVSFGSGNGLLIDDLYFADGTTGPGSFPNNSFLGDGRTATLFPISNNAVSWVPLANTNWQEVSEISMDGDGSYNSTATPGAQDSFNFGVLDVDVNQVLGLQITVALRKLDAGSRTVAPVIIISGTAYVGTPVSVDVSYLYITSIWPINPYTNASWTAADINALIAGYVVVT